MSPADSDFASSLNALLARAARESWNYPRTFDALKDFGVQSYDVDVPRHRIVYRGDGAELAEGPPPGFEVLPLADRFDSDAFLQALRRAQRRETNYSQFLREIAAAGVSRYHVDMAARTVTYFGVGGEEQVEPVPPSAP